VPRTSGNRRKRTTLRPVASGGYRRRRIDAGGTRLRLRALAVMGHGSARVAREAGVSDQAIQKLTRGDVKTVSPRLRDAIAAVYDAWWDKRAPERSRAERAAATAARRRAIAGNWCAGAGLDDDQLDIPGYRPAQGWKPAQGTGVATTLCQSTRPARIEVGA
jgi:transcriptional regulator with XRE-family HTH domain